MSEFGTLERWKNIIADNIGVDMTKSIKHSVLLDDFSLCVDGIGYAFWRWSTITSIELDSEIFIWTTWIVTGRENNTTEAVSISIVLVELSNESGDSWS